MPSCLSCRPKAIANDTELYDTELYDTEYSDTDFIVLGACFLVSLVDADTIYIR